MIKKAKLVCCVLVVLGIVLTFSSCWTLREKIYYSDKENFVTVSGVVVHMKRGNERLCLGIEIDGEHDFSDIKFVFNEANAKIVVSRNLMQEIAIGDRVTIISAPKHFGDGYAYPIVEIRKGDKVYLGFDEGYENLMSEYD